MKVARVCIHSYESEAVPFVPQIHRRRPGWRRHCRPEHAVAPARRLWLSNYIEQDSHQPQGKCSGPLKRQPSRAEPLFVCETCDKDDPIKAADKWLKGELKPPNGVAPASTGCPTSDFGVLKLTSSVARPGDGMSIARRMVYRAYSTELYRVTAMETMENKHFLLCTAGIFLITVAAAWITATIHSNTQIGLTPPKK
jgi:hypothetical protein